MKKKDAFELVAFVENHYDYVSQEDWFGFCDKVMGLVVDEANKRGYAGELVEKHPGMFRVAS